MIRYPPSRFQRAGDCSPTPISMSSPIDLVYTDWGWFDLLGQSRPKAGRSSRIGEGFPVRVKSARPAWLRDYAVTDVQQDRLRSTRPVGTSLEASLICTTSGFG